MNRAFLPSLTQNPIILKEMRGRMRGNRALLLLTLYVVLMSLMIGVIYLTFLTANDGVRTVEERQIFGKIIFSAVVLMEMFMISFVAPALSAGSIASERENQTYDLLRTTLLPARSLVAGKFLSGISFILLLLLAAVPLQSLAFFFGGVALEEVVIGTIILVVMAVSFCAFGIFFSSFIKRTLVSTVMAYAFTIFVLFGVPMLLMFGATLFGVIFSGNTTMMSPVSEAVLFTGFGLILSTNPMSAAITTEIMLIENQNPWILEFPINGANPLTMASPWITYSIFYGLLSVILISLSVYFVKRAER